MTGRKQLTAVLAVMTTLVPAAIADARPLHAAAAGRTVNVAVTAKTTSQLQLLRDGYLTLRLAGGGAGIVGVTADGGTPGKLTAMKGVAFAGEEVRFARLTLTAEGRERAAACSDGGQRWRVTTKSGNWTVSRWVTLAEDEEACLPPEAEATCRGGDPLDRSRCLLPFPNDIWTRGDSGTATGRRLNLPNALMPVNSRGVRIPSTPYRGNDGFSGNSAILTRVPGLDSPEALVATGAAGIQDIGRSLDPDAPIVVIDAATGARFPVWSEVDVTTADLGKRLLITRGARTFDEGHRYIVALRNLKRADGSAIEAKEIFKWYRDKAIPATAPDRVKARAAKMEDIFNRLESAGIERSSLYQAWDFTIASEENMTGPALTMRDKAFATLGDTNLADFVAQGSSPQATITAVENYSLSDSRYVLKRVDGKVRVPCFMGHVDTNGKEVGPCGPGTRLNIGSDGRPEQARDGGGNPQFYEANFTCIVPRESANSSAMGTGKGAVLFGHGLLGTGADVTSIKSHVGLEKAVACGADWIGLSREDIPNAIGTLIDLSRFPALADRSVQGLINFLFLGRWMISQAPGGLNDTAEFKPASGQLVDPAQKLYNLGGSQGGIMGTALTALAPDFERSLLAVPAVGYSTLLNRSAAFELFGPPVRIGYPDPATQQILLSLVQTLWDRGEGGGYVHHVTDDPLPNTPSHKVFMIEAFGDHLVANIGTETMARTIGAVARTPILDPGRSPDREPFFGIPHGDSAVFNGAGFDGPASLVVIDIGPLRTEGGRFRGVTAAPPFNIPPVPAKDAVGNNGIDPHADVAKSDSSVTMLFEFFKPDGAVRAFEACGFGPCYAEGWGGPPPPP